ncbi:peroxisomal ATPase PEX6-like isoform X2 [Clavelina lepadiformis]|uniref:peroxisomal ATPase PEX6-like isoform X2 n=1 Tax=Clavelina lepadiformis TaxID=159417 RepID=UPI004041794E
MDCNPCLLFANKRWPSASHSLHLMTDRVKWITHNGQCDSPRIVALVQSQNTLLQRPSLFVVLHLENCPDAIMEEEFDERESSIRKRHVTVFLCSEEFLEHYNLKKVNKPDQLFFVLVTAFPLERVVLAATTEETFEWANKQGFETGLMVASTCDRSFLVRCDDIFLSRTSSSYGNDSEYVLQRFKELKVLECSPVQQGIFGIYTSLVVVNAQVDGQHEETEGITMTSSRTLTIQVADGLGAYLKSPPIRSQNGTMSMIFCSETTARNSEIKSGNFVKFTYAEQLKEENDEIIDEIEQDYISIDVEETKPKEIYSDKKSRIVIMQTVPDEIFCGCSKNDKKGNISQTISSKCLQTVRVSPSLWFNFIGKENILLATPLNVSIQISQLSKDDDPLYARQMNLSMVLSPTYPPAGVFDKCLVKMFQTPQIVKLGDIITINVEGDCDFSEAADIKSSRCKVIHYKVMGLGEEISNDRCYLVDTKHTSIYQEGTTNSYIPHLKLADQKLAYSGKNVCCIPGLNKYANQLRDIMTPYLLPKGTLDHVCSVLLSGQGGCGKWSIAQGAMQSCNLHLVKVDCRTLVSDTPGASEAKINDAFRKASLYAPCAILLSDIDSIGINRETGRPDNRVCAALCKAINNLPYCTEDEALFPVVVIATTNDKSNVVADIRTQFLHQIDIEAPTEGERFDMIKNACGRLVVSRDMNYQWIAKHTAGFVLGDIWELMRKTVQASHARLIRKCSVGTKLTWRDEQCLCMAGVTSTHEDVRKALEQMQSDRADAIGVPKIPEVKWDDIGGLEEVKTHILDTIQLPLDHPELLSTGLRRSGVLLYGPPGTGKTLLAKAVASQCSLSFLSVKGPELINMYVGQSEANVRRVFQRARDAAPCVVFFDELDALAPNRGRSGDSGGVMDRVVSQLLAELDGVNAAEDKDKQIFIIAASNRPDLIDQALLRPGRLDKLIYVGISENQVDKVKVLKAQTRKLHLAPEVNFDEVVKVCPANMTGADFYALTTEAAMNSVRRRIADLEANKDASAAEPCLVEQDDLLEAAANIVPSVNSEQIANYKRVKAEMAR